MTIELNTIVQLSNVLIAPVISQSGFAGRTLNSEG
jgi:hypothetical protein